MAKGTALFDAVAISDAEAGVRAGRRCEPGPMPAGAGVGGRGARPICGGLGCTGCAQYGNGGVVRMDDGAVTFKGGTISNTKAVRARVAFARRMPQMLVLDATCCARRCMP